MNDQELIAKLEEVVQACRKSHPNVAGILSVIIGTIHMGPEEMHELAGQVRAFTIKMINKINARNN